MIRVLIAEDQTLVRGALARLLDLEDDIEVVAQAQDGRQAIELALVTQPQVALVDIEMPHLSGLEVISVLAKTVPQCRALIVTTFARPGYLKRAMQFGAAGYMLKDAEITELAAAIRTVANGGKVIDPNLMMAALDNDNPLSEREVALLHRAAEGLSTRALARELFLTEGTVRNYLSEIFSKLAVDNRQEAIRVASEKGWL